MLSGSNAASGIRARLRPGSGAVVSYATVEELMQQERLDSVAVLVIDSPRQPNALLLAALGRMNLEYPAMQKVAFLEGEPSLPIASYLTGCGVDLVCRHGGEEAIDELATVVDRMRERTKWIVS